jgi:hypothetical protein
LIWTSQMMAKRRGAWRGSRRMSRAPGCPVFKVIDDELPRALADGSRQRLYRGEGSPSPPCRFADVFEAFSHCRRLRAHRCRVVRVEPIVIQLRLTCATRALIAISNVCTRVQDAHGVLASAFVCPQIQGEHYLAFGHRVTSQPGQWAMNLHSTYSMTTWFSL